MKIKRPPKKQPSSNALIAAFISSLATANDDELPEMLESVLAVGWTWPRTDLQHWINPLNRFDAMLDQIVTDYDLATLEHPQINQFTPRTKQSLLAILRFEKLLLENSTNRKIYASFDRLNDLLHTSDLTVLLATLKLGLRPAQQYSLQNNGTSSFGIGEARLLSLAQGWSTREYGLEMVDLAQDKAEIPQELDELEWQFYKRSTATPTDKGKEVAQESIHTAPAPAPAPAEPSTSAAQASTSAAIQPSHPSTPGPRPRAAFAHGAALATPIPHTPATPAAATSTGSYFPPTEGLTTINLGNVRLNPKPAADILLDAIEANSIPEPDRLDLLQKIRIAKSLRDPDARRTMLCVRLLAIAVFAHTVTEATAQSKLFLYEPELITQLAEMVHPDRNVHIDIQSSALYALDALAKFKHKLTEVASALNAGVSHGILMYVLRTTVADQATEHPTTTTEFVDALFNLLTYFHTNSFVGNMIVGAGAVNTLVELAKNDRRDRVPVVTKAVVFLDGMMYGYTSAFNLFIAASGLGVFVDRVKTEVDLYVEAYAAKVQELTATESPIDTPTGLLSFEQANLLKGLLRALQRLMQTAGTTEGLRNLIDSSLLKSVKAIIQNRFIFGSQVLGLAINMTATFVHNEPTCLATIQEAKVPAALYDAIEQSIPASIDVMQAIPNAIGALCLNAPGLAEFNERQIVHRYFDMFTSERHVKTLNERDNAAMLGGAIDELTRHHPTLKEPTMKAIVRVFEQIREQGRAFTPESQEGYGLELPKESTAEAGSTATAADSGAVSTSAGPTPVVDVAMQDTAPPVPITKFGEQEVKDNHVQDSIDVIGRFLEGMFQSMQHCKEFIKLNPVPLLLDLLELPCAPCLNSASAAFASISAIFKLMSEQKAPELAQAIVERLKASLDKTRWLWDTPLGDSKLEGWIKPKAETVEAENAKFRDVTVLLSYVALLSDLYANLTYAHGKTATAVLAVLATAENVEVLGQVGQLYRSCTWETITLKGKLPGAPTDLASALTKLAEGVPPSGLALTEAPAAAAGPDATSASGPTPAPSSPAKSINFKSVEDVITNIPLNITPFLQAAIKMFVHRRSTDDLHRKAANSVAGTIARMMQDSLIWPDSGDLNANLAYSTMMIGAIGGLLFDERSNHTGLQTLLLSFFDQVGGIDSFLSLYARYQQVATSLLDNSDANKSEVGPVVHVFGGLKIALDFLQRLTSHRTVLEAPQTGLLVAREKEKTSPDFFDPTALLVKLRAAILPVISSTWQVDWLRKSPPNLVRAIVGTFINVLRAEGESSSEPLPTPAAVGGGPSSRLETMLVNALGGGGAGGILGVGPGAGAGVLGGLGGAPPGGRAPFQLDQERVSQLIDMGFPRQAVETALTRCRNNVAVATEYLLQHPDLIGAARAAEEAGPAAADAPAAAVAPAEGHPAEGAPANAVAPSDGAPAESAAAAADPAGADVEMGGTGAGEAEPAPLEPIVPEDTRPKVDPEAREAANKEMKDKLNALRDEIKPQFLPQALSLAEDYGDLVFDIKAIFSLLTSSAENSAANLDPLLDALRSSETTEQAVAVRLRVLALLGTDAAFKDAVQTKRDDLMTVLAGFGSRYLEQSPAAESRPKWLASLMLVVDSLFSLSEAPVEIEVVPVEQTPLAPEAVPQGPAWADHRDTFFKLTMDVLAKGVSTRDVFISTLRLLLVLTRTETIAQAFLAQDGLKLLFSSFATERPETAGCRSYVVMIVRHLIEEQSFLRPMMEREIEAWFSHPSRPKVPDVTAFLRGASSIALRNIPAFLSAAQKLLKLVSADAPGHYYLALQNERKEPAKPNEAEQTILSPFAEGQTDATMEDAATATKKAQAVAIMPPAPLGVETTVHFLMSELMQATKAALAPVEPVKITDNSSAAPTGPATELAAADVTAPVPASAVPASADKFEVPADTPLGDFYQAAFGMSCLSELIASYSGCKSAFLTFSTRRTGKEAISTAVAPKSRSSFLYYLLTELVPVGTIVNPTDFEGRRRAAVSHWASVVVVALTHDSEATAHSKDSKETHLEIVSVRKAVLDGIARAFKEATIQSSEPTEIRYGRLFALSDLCYRMLVAKPIGAGPSAREEPSMQMAKLMLEKNFAVILTNALAEVDLNFPNVNNLINTILRPLETLTKVVTKVGKAKATGAVTAGDDDEDDQGETDSTGTEGDEDEEVEIDTDDDTPDLYRNSALGLFEGELEPGHDGLEESGEEEDFGEDDEMMEYEDEGMPAGSDVSDISDDDGEGDEDMDDIEEILDTDGSSDLDGDSDSEDDEDDDPLEIEDGDEEDHELEEMLGAGDNQGEWFDEDGDEDGEMLDGGADGALADGFAEAGAILAGEEDDPDSFTDEEEMFMTGDLEFDQDMTDQLDAQAAGVVHRGGGARQADAINLGNGDVFFDRPAQRNPQAQTAQHPLLVESAANESSQLGPGARRPRVSPSGARNTAEYEQWANSVEQMIGPGAVEALQQLLDNNGMPRITGPDQVRLSIARGPDGGLSMMVDPTSLRGEVQTAPRGGVDPINALLDARRARPAQSARSVAKQLTDRLNASQEFMPQPTLVRWGEEGRVLQSSVLVAERVQRLTNHLINLLHPPARAVAKEEDVRRKVEEAAAAEKKRKEEQEKAEREAAEAQTAAPAEEGAAAGPSNAIAAEAEDPETMVRNLARSLATGLAVPSPSIGTPTPQAATPAPGGQADLAVGQELSEAEVQAIRDLVAAEDDYEVDMDEDGEDDFDEDEHMFEGATDSEDEGLHEGDDEGHTEDEDEGEGEGGAEGEPAGARITIQIHGREVDITDTGIDPDFLEALPDQMREEVLSQHFREARRAAPPAPEVPSALDAEFLAALPEDVRAEVLRQEASDRRREEANRARAAAQAQAAAAPAAAGGVPAPAAPAAPAPARVERAPTAAAAQVARAYEAGGDSMEPDDFLASLPGHVRGRFLAELERGYTNGVPQQLLDDLEALEEETGGGELAAVFGHAAARLGLGRSGGAPQVKKATAHREAIQLLDKSGLATLVRLLFFPQPLKRGSLQRVLAHLCENSRTRTELIQLLLTILQDGTRDVSAVDKSFSQMSIRASKSLAQAGPAGGLKETPKRKASTLLGGPVVDTPGGSLPHFPGESVPNLIAQRCLEALEQLVRANELSAVFFLTEQEVAAGLNVKRSAKKGKGKDKAVPSTVYPITVLLGLLDRPAILKTQSMMDQLTTLLSTITKTLAVLQKKKQDIDGIPPPTEWPDVEGVVGHLLDDSDPDHPATVTGAERAAEAVAAAPAAAPPKEKEVPAPVGAEILVQTPPLLPASVIRLVVNILDAGECSSTTFKQTLGLIQNLSYLPDAREIISEELKARAQSLSVQLKPDLDELLAAIQSGQTVRGPTLAKFSPASALQAKLLRILKTIDWLHSSKKGSTAAAATAAVNGSATPALTDSKALTPEEQKVSEIFASFPFEPVFQALSACLSAVADKPDNLNIATILLPLIEVVLVICKHVGSERQDGSSGGAFSVPVTPAVEAGSPPFESAAGVSPIELAFKQFTTEHKAILNTLIRANPGLMSGSFAILVRNAKILEFPNKRTFFFSRLHDRTQRQRNHYPNLQVNVRRQHVFEDSFVTLQSRTGDEIKYGKLNIKFWGEEGVDAGGVTREWFSVLARQMFNPGYALFQPQAADSLTYQPNKSSGIANEHHLRFFRFVGRIIGKALHDQRILEAYFSRSVYKHMLGKPVDHKDLESIDPDYYKSLVWMLENDIDGVLDLTMSIERDEFGVVEVVDLVPNGRNVEVTNANKSEYVRLIAENRLTTEIRDQIGALLKGLYEVVPKDLLQIFSEKELELLISGLPEIDVDEWRANTDLNNFAPGHPVIGYFWRAVRSFSHEERAKLLQFVSGSSRVPLEGFGSLQGMSGVTKFSITNAGAVKSLPTAHTCFNQLDLASSYETYEELRSALVTSITEGAGSFGFA